MADAGPPSGRGGGRGRKSRRHGRNEEGRQQKQTDYWQRTPKEFREWAAHLVTKKKNTTNSPSLNGVVFFVTLRKRKKVHHRHLRMD
eukprot:scaffold3484_cov184-Amphora_coffeaeformis.AAC.1